MDALLVTQRMCQSSKRRNLQHLAVQQPDRMSENSIQIPQPVKTSTKHRPSRSTVTSDVVGLFLVWLIRSSTSSITPVTRSPHRMMPLPTYLLISSSLIPNACTEQPISTCSYVCNGGSTVIRQWVPDRRSDNAERFRWQCYEKQWVS